MTVRKLAARIPLSITLLGIVIVITPLCGYLFGCGCTWPWSGFLENCNYFDPHEKYPCPFCENLPLSVPLLSGSALIGLVISDAANFSKRNVRGSILFDALGGLIVFILLTVIAGSLF